ncbi:hypothetical protein D3C87_1839410 [compost metagenome]
MLELDEVGGIDAGTGLELQQAEALGDPGLVEDEPQGLGITGLVPGGDELGR